MTYLGSMNMPFYFSASFGVGLRWSRRKEMVKQEQLGLSGICFWRCLWNSFLDDWLVSFFMCFSWDHGVSFWAKGSFDVWCTWFGCFNSINLYLEWKQQFLNQIKWCLDIIPLLEYLTQVLLVVFFFPRKKKKKNPESRLFFWEFMNFPWD